MRVHDQVFAMYVACSSALISCKRVQVVSEPRSATYRTKRRLPVSEIAHRSRRANGFVPTSEGWLSQLAGLVVLSILTVRLPMHDLWISLADLTDRRIGGLLVVLDELRVDHSSSKWQLPYSVARHVRTVRGFVRPKGMVKVPRSLVHRALQCHPEGAASWHSQ